VEGKVTGGVQAASAQFEEGRNTAAMQTGIPAQDDWIKKHALNPVRGKLNEYGREVGRKFQAAAAPAVADFSRKRFANQNSSAKDL
jgi:hypothetical protein